MAGTILIAATCIIFLCILACCCRMYSNSAKPDTGDVENGQGSPCGKFYNLLIVIDWELRWFG